MISVLVFSKDRPLQLHAYLDSLIRFSGIPEHNINILYKDNKNILYDEVINNFHDAKWIKENNFVDDLMSFLEKAEEYILFGCDDVIYTDYLDLNTAISVLARSSDVFGFSFRLGLNIKPNPNASAFQRSKDYLSWNWMEIKTLHWDYPWELDATLYRKNEIVNILMDIEPKTISNPNYLEATIANHARSYIFKSDMACFPKSKCIVITVNRVQDSVINGYDASKATMPEELSRRYREGERIKYWGLPENDIIHVGAEYFFLTKGVFNVKYKVSIKYFIFIRKIISSYVLLRDIINNAKKVSSKIIRLFYRIARKAIVTIKNILSRLRFGGNVRVRDNRILIKSCKTNFFHRNLRLAINGKNNQVIVDESCYMEKSSIRLIGDGNCIVFGPFVHGIVDIEIVADNCKVSIDERTGFTGTEIRLWDSMSELSIGRDTIIAKETRIYVTDFHSIIDVHTQKPLNKGSYIRIGDHCWLGEGVKVLKNVEIASDIIIGAASVVTRDLSESHAIYAGVPAILKKEDVSWTYEKYDTAKARI